MRTTSYQWDLLSIHRALLSLTLAAGFAAVAAGQSKDPPKDQPGKTLPPAASATDAKGADAKGSKEKPKSGAELAAEIANLIKQLGDDEYAVRQRAQERLAEIGADAFDALADSQGHEDPEVAARSRFLLKSIRVELVKETDPATIRQLMKDYQGQDATRRMATIQALARLSEPEGTVVLCRLARFEQGEQLAKQAAVAVIAQKLTADRDLKQRGGQIQETLGHSQRTAARWLRAYADVLRGEAQRVQADWAKLADEEAATLRRAPTRTSPLVVAELLKFHVELLSRVGRDKDVPQVMTQLVELQPEDSESLSDLIHWVQGKKAWAALDAIQKRYGERIEKDVFLLYAMATARESQGDAKLAEDLATKALALNADNPRQRYQTALMLRDRGMIRWAEREFRQLIGKPPAYDIYSMVARYVLSEWLHDQDRDGEAGRVLEEAVTAMQKNIKEGTPENNGQREVGAIKARMNYFQALELRDKDPVKHVELLDKALEADPKDADVLIALHRLPKPDAARKAKTSKQIQEAVASFRQEIASEPEEAQGYNQLAWLVGNTEGDYQEALECSLKSLQIKPNTGAYLDTLGRCYYAVKDYPNALKHQRMAVAKDPHSKQMQRQLALFEKAVAEKPASDKAAPKRSSESKQP